MHHWVQEADQNALAAVNPEFRPFAYTTSHTALQQCYVLPTLSQLRQRHYRLANTARVTQPIRVGILDSHS